MILGHRVKDVGNIVGRTFGRRKVEAYNMRLLYHSTTRSLLEPILRQELKPGGANADRRAQCYFSARPGLTPMTQVEAAEEIEKARIENRTA